MALASVISSHESELRADLQQYYGIDLDVAANGNHSAHHIAALVSQLPRESRLRRIYNSDDMWSLTDVLLALLVNDFRSFGYGMSDPKKRGQRPEPIGPSYMTNSKKKTLPARVMPIDELVQELSKPRRCANV